MIDIEREICRDLESARDREWLETNGLGGFASSTIIGLNTRRYHGLLFAATKPPVGRTSLLSKLEETLIIDGERFDLSTNQYPGTIHPEGYQYLRRFRLDPFPIFTYQVQGIEIEKSVFLVYGENTVVVQYKHRKKNKTASDCRLEIRPLISFRDYHQLTYENDSLNRVVNESDGLLSVQPYSGLPSLYLAHDAEYIESAGHWYRGFEYQVEQDRGLDFKEDLFNPCALTFNLNEHTSATIIGSTEPRKVSSAARYRKSEITRREGLLKGHSKEQEFISTLKKAADQFIVARDDLQTVIAGYHWFGDWGRDTMIALPGLTITTERPEIAKKLLLAFAKYVDRGMLPNRFPDAGEAPEYNTVDATLWYFEAIRALLALTGDYDFVRENLYDVLVDIIDWHKRGTRYGIHVDGDGLLAAGEPGVQLTWMDARVGGKVITPRMGKPVEIQALWYNALCITQDIAMRCGDPAFAANCAELAGRASDSFNRLFWNETEECLCDVIEGSNQDRALRPNQIFAVSLHHSMLSPERAVAVVEKVEAELLTPFGLRSLSPHDPEYCGRCVGDIESRDGAYHQGTIWAWLIGPFITAYLKVNDRSPEAIARAWQMISYFTGHLQEAGLGQVSEIFDGDPPYRPAGCIAQAWSVAELLRVAVDLDH